MVEKKQSAPQVSHDVSSVPPQQAPMPSSASKDEGRRIVRTADSKQKQASLAKVAHGIVKAEGLPLKDAYAKAKNLREQAVPKKSN